ncbi:MAG: hypothetical protein IPK19_25630 [Chloroflexi bacterium]|nr:hypothetical protein [Chloroflexota bacterium]
MFKRRPVQRVDADSLWLIMLISFAVSVVVTRLYLEATGYPQIGTGVLHIAHVLWGGLLQFVALVVFLTYANRWTTVLSAILGGAGIGLFIDEVGKFITQTNDYFFPFAAPIIYAMLLMTAVLTLYLRRTRPRSGRAHLYWVLDQLKDVVDQDFDRHERQKVLEALVEAKARAENDAARDLAEELLHLVENVPVIEPPQPNVVQRWVRRLQALETRYLSRTLLRWLLVGGMALVSSGAILVLVAVAAMYGEVGALDQLLVVVVSEAGITSALRFQWGLIHGVMTVISGLLLAVAAVLLVLRRDSAAIPIGRLTLIFELTVVNLLAFYFRQFAMIFATLNTLIVLLAMERYRRRFMSPVLDTKHIGDVQRRLQPEP